MPEVAALQQRLQDIARSLAGREDTLALIGLGSAGSESARMDQYSDLDFFVIVRPGAKQALLDDLSWLEDIRPLVYCFLNTADGYKALHEDGIYCEFAVFTPAEFKKAVYTAARIVWQRPEFDVGLVKADKAPPTAREAEWQVGEALTCIYVGLCRFLRGERLAAMRFVQVFALDRVVELAPGLEQPAGAMVDPFGGERRFEARFPGLAARLPALAPGYAATPRAAEALLAFFEERFPVNQALAREIRRLIRQAEQRQAS